MVDGHLSLHITSPTTWERHLLTEQHPHISYHISNPAWHYRLDVVTGSTSTASGHICKPGHSEAQTTWLKTVVRNVCVWDKPSQLLWEVLFVRVGFCGWVWWFCFFCCCCLVGFLCIKMIGRRKKMGISVVEKFCSTKAAAYLLFLWTQEHLTPWLSAMTSIL